MPYSEEIKKHHIERIREVISLKQRVSNIAIQKILANDSRDPINLELHYVGKLILKIRQERKSRYNQAVVDQRLAEIQDRTETVIEQMWRILLDTSNLPTARVAAGKTIIDAEHKFLEAQMNAGIFERKLGTLDVKHEHEHTLAPELALPILNALRNYGIIERKKVENIIEQTHANTNPALGAPSEPAHQ